MDILIPLLLSLSVVTCGALLRLILKEKRDTLSRIFCIYLIGIAGWNLFILVFVFTEYSPLIKLCYLFASTFVLAQLWFATLVPDRHKAPTWLYTMTGVGIVIALASMQDGAVFSDVVLKPGRYIVTSNGYLSSLYSLFNVGASVLAIVLLVRKRLQTTNQTAKTQLSYLASGIVIFLLINIFSNSILPVFFNVHFFNTIGPAFSMMLATSVFYIIWRHQFLDIHVVIKRGAIYLATSTLLLAAYFGILTLLAENAHWITKYAAPVAAFFVLIIGGFIVYAIERYFNKLRLLKRERQYSAELEQKVLERTGHIRNLQAYQERMTYEITHALQTPLSILRSAVQNDDNERVTGSIDRLSRLIYNLMRLSKLETAPLSTDQKFDLKEVVEETTEYVTTMCVEHDISLAVEAKDSVSLNGDRAEWEEVLTNLLSNAVRHTANTNKAEKYIKVTLNTKALIIEDNGEGIPPERLSEIFLPFHRLSSDQRGNGLGLAIVDRIVRRHGGTIKAESQLGKGTTFTITLPPLS